MIEELKSITDPNGGGWYKGRYVKSLVSEIGYVIEKHITNKSAPVVVAPVTKVESNNDIPGATKCPSCGVKAVIKKDGCPTCLACGDSKCG